MVPIAAPSQALGNPGARVRERGTRPIGIAGAAACIALLLAALLGGGTGAGLDPGIPARLTAQGVRFVGSVDTMKLSRDRADTLGAGEIARVTDLLTRSMSTTHVTVDTALEKPSVVGDWAKRIHADGKRVWFRLASTTCDQPHGDLGDGYPSYRPGYLTELHALIRAHPGFFAAGDILDGDPEAENSCWWVDRYGCGVQSACPPCGPSGANAPCAPIRQFNAFLERMTEQERMDLAASGVEGVTTNVHSTDPGTATKILSRGLVRSMGNLITVDAYPDQSATDPLVAARAWKHALTSWHDAWKARGVDVSILVGEWGYALRVDVDDASQLSAIRAEVSRAFSAVPYLVGMNYWVGPGTAGDGGYTQILEPDATGAWRLRPAAAVVSGFYAAKNSR